MSGVSSGTLSALSANDILNKFDTSNPGNLNKVIKIEYIKRGIFDMQDNQLTCRIPAELGQLSVLKELSLHDNWLTGPIPTKLGQLKALTELYLDHTRLTGPIPAKLRGLTKL